MYIALYIDDNLMIGDISAIDNTIKAVKSKGLVLKIMERLQDYSSCEIKFSEDKKRAWLGQPHLIKNMQKQFGKLVQDVQIHKTPGTPKFLIIRPSVKIETILHRYVIVPGETLAPHLANVSRELSKANNGSNPAAYKEILCVTRYVLDTKNLGIQIEPVGNSNKPW